MLPGANQISLKCCIFIPTLSRHLRQLAPSTPLSTHLGCE
jgi:hypothetical protein